MVDVLVTTEGIIRFTMFDDRGDRDRKNFTVIIGETLYTFVSPEFMQGFATAAQWAGLDHHQYWKDLVHHTVDENHKYVPQNITF